MFGKTLFLFVLAFLLTICCLIVSAMLCLYNPTHSRALDCFKMRKLLMGVGVYRGAVMTLRSKPYGYKKDHIYHVKTMETYSTAIPLDHVAVVQIILK